MFRVTHGELWQNIVGRVRATNAVHGEAAAAEVKGA